MPIENCKMCGLNLGSSLTSKVQALALSLASRVAHASIGLGLEDPGLGPGLESPSLGLGLDLVTLALTTSLLDTLQEV